MERSNRAGTWGVCAVVAMVGMSTGCPPRSSSTTTSSTSSGGSSGYNGDPLDIRSYCDLFYDLLYCNGYCPGSSDHDQCHRFADATCEALARDFQRLVDEGRTQYDPVAAGRCMRGYSLTYAPYYAALCSDGGAIDYSEYYRALYGTYTCSNGRAQWSGGLYNTSEGEEDLAACETTFAGTRSIGSACGNSVECQGTNSHCTAVDGGCGDCVSDGGTSGVVDAGTGCVRYTDAGPELGSCPAGSNCDLQTQRCLQQRSQGETCGPGVGQCSLPCSMRCLTAGGSSTCQLFGQDGVDCSQATTYQACGRGFACVFPSVSTTSGAVCRAQVNAGERCGEGTNYDEYADEIPYYADFYSGGYSYFGNLCASGLVCELDGDGGALGYCRAWGQRNPGETCRQGPNTSDTCTPDSSCRVVDGGFVRTCQPRLNAGERCDSDSDCVSGLRCDLPTGSFDRVCMARAVEGAPCDMDTDCLNNMRCRYEGSEQRCRADVAVGGACDEDGDCGSLFVACHQGVCTERGDVPYPETPICQ